MIYLVAAIAGMAGFLFGFDEGVIAGALNMLRSQFGMDPFMEGVVTSAVPFGALFGSLMAGWMAHALGRRATLLLAGSLFVVGALAAAAAGGNASLTFARLLLGFAVGLAAIVAPLYISENSPAEKRGMLVSIYQLAITLGILGAYVVGYAFSDSWRTMFAIGALPGLALAIGIYRMSDTPQWLATKGRRAEAREVLAQVRGCAPDDPVVVGELAAIERAVAQEASHSASWGELLSPVVRPALIVGVGLFLLQQLSGINAVIYYAPTVFKEAGFDSHSIQLLATTGIGIVNVLMTFVGMVFIDRIGRRKLLYWGFAGTGLGLGMIAIAAATSSEALDVLSIIGLVIYIGAFAASIGPLPWVMMSEIFPLSVRTQGMSIASVANWGMNFIVVFSFPIMVTSMGLAGVFGVYAAFCILGLYFAWRFAPETSGVTLEAIEAHLRSGQPFRELGNPLNARAGQRVAAVAAPLRKP